MDFKKICKRNDYVDISGDIAWFMNDHRWHSLVMPKGKGKTTLLSMLYYFFDTDENTYDLFKDAAVAKEWDGWQDYLNKRVVIALDFSGFNAKNMNAALDHIRLNMLKLYKEKLHHIMENKDRQIRRYMEILLTLEQSDLTGKNEENPGSSDNLAYSLSGLLWDFYHGEYSKENAVLLIDNICRIEQVARLNGYYSEMKEFLRKFLSFEPDKMCCVYLQVWDADSERKYYRGEYFCYDPPFMPHNEKMYWRADEETLGYSTEDYIADIKVYITTKGTAVKDLYIGSVKELII